MYLPTFGPLAGKKGDTQARYRETAKLLQGYEAKEAARAGSSHVSESFESFIPSINAWASVMYPKDELGFAALGVPDMAAGDLVRPTVGAHVDTFGMQVIRVYRKPPLIELSGLLVEEHDGLTFFHELDLQAAAFSGGAVSTFAQLDPASQAYLAYLIAFGLVTPIDPHTGGSAGLAYQFQVALVANSIAYWMNFPYHRLRNGLLGTGEGDPRFTAPAADLISNPNLRISDGATFTAAWSYSTWAYPARNTVEADMTDAFIDWQGATSNASFVALNANTLNGTLINQGS